MRKEVEKKKEVIRNEEDNNIIIIIIIIIICIRISALNREASDDCSIQYGW